MFVMRSHTAHQRGDTIVEVLVAITVVSMVLGGAYVTTNKSLLATRGAQERSNALKLTESQLEQLKALAASGSTAVLNASAPFCIYNQTNVVAATDPHCTQDTAGNQTTQEPKFSISTTRNGNTFDVQTTWADVSGDQTDRLNLIYRVYQ